MPETLEEMQKAAPARLADGEALVEAGFWDGGIYLLGYTAEMVLKIAYCRLDPTLLPTTVVKDVFGTATQQWRNLFFTAPPKQFAHNVIFWETVLGQQRLEHHHSSLPASVALIASRCAHIVDQHWDVEMRYQPPKFSMQDALAVRIAVRWLYANRHILWS